MASKYQSCTETTNFARLCRLLVSISSDLLRDVLDAKIPPPGLTAFLKSQNHQLLKCLKGHQRQVIYPSSGWCVGTLQNVDFSLLYILARNLQGINIPPHSKGWGFQPDTADRSLSANIERLRFQRNEAYGHLLTASLPDSDFIDRWNLIRQCVSEIESAALSGDKYVTAVDNLLTMSMDPDQELYYTQELEKLHKEDMEVKDILNDVKDDVAALKVKVDEISANTRDVKAGQTEPFPEVRHNERLHLTDKIQRLELRKRKHHADMIKDISGYIDPKLPTMWDRFRNGLKPYLTEHEIYCSDVTYIGQMCDSLSRKGYIKLGEYSELFDVINSVDARAGEIVERATKAIRDINSEISALKHEDRSDNPKRSAYTEEDLFSIQARSHHSSRQAWNEEDLFPEHLRQLFRPVLRTLDIGKKENMINQTENWINWERQKYTFIPTNAFNVALDIIQKSNLLLIRGNCGDGKSVLAFEIIAWLMGDHEKQNTVNRRKKAILLKELKSWDETISCRANLAIFVDDVFGYRSMYSEDLTWWKKISPFIRPILEGDISNDGNCMIVTVRNDIYLEHKSLFCHEDVSPNNECVVDLSSTQRLQTEEKKNILRSYMPTDIELSPDEETAIIQSDSPFGFPECCRIFKSLTDMHCQPKEYFLKPLVYIKRVIRERLSKNKQAALWFLLLCKGQVTVSQLKSEWSNAEEDHRVTLAFKVSFSGDNILSSRLDTGYQTKQNIKEGLESMIGSLVKFESDTFTFYHDVVEDAVAILFGEITDTRGFIRNVDITHLRYVVTSKCNEMTIFVGKEHKEYLYNRVLDELKSRERRKYDILTALRVWDDRDFLQDFIAWVQEQESIPNDFYFRWTTTECTPEMKEASTTSIEDMGNKSFSFFVFVAKSNKDYLLQQLIEIGESNAIQMKLALDQACGSGNVKCASKLLEIGITPDSTTWTCVVKGGSLDLLEILVSLEIYPNVTTDDETFDVKNVNMLQLACLYEKEQVALYLVKKHSMLMKQRDNDGNSLLHHIAMTNNCDLFEKIRTEFYSESEDSMSLLRRNDGVTVLHVACNSANLSGRKGKIYKYLYNTYPFLIAERDNAKRHCLHYAAVSGDVDCFMYLDNFANEGKSDTERLQFMKTLLTSGGGTVLHRASLAGKKAMCTHLYQTYLTLLSQRDNFGRHCLHYAAESGDVDCFMYLDNLVNVGKSDTERQQFIETLCTSDGRTVLHQASLKGKKAMCTHLYQTYPTLSSQRKGKCNIC